jgi:hypothetical protein
MLSILIIVIVSMLFFTAISHVIEKLQHYKIRSTTFVPICGVLLSIVLGLVGTRLITVDYILGGKENERLTTEYANQVEKAVKKLHDRYKVPYSSQQDNKPSSLLERNKGIIVLNEKVSDEKGEHIVLAADLMRKMPADLLPTHSFDPQLIILISNHSKDVATIIGAGAREVYDWSYEFEIINFSDLDELEHVNSECQQEDDSFPNDVYERVLEKAKDLILQLQKP